MQVYFSSGLLLLEKLPSTLRVHDYSQECSLQNYYNIKKLIKSQCAATGSNATAIAGCRKT